MIYLTKLALEYVLAYPNWIFVIDCVYTVSMIGLVAKILSDWVVDGKRDWKRKVGI